MLIDSPHLTRNFEKFCKKIINFTSEMLQKLTIVIFSDLKTQIFSSRFTSGSLGLYQHNIDQGINQKIVKRKKKNYLGFLFPKHFIIS